MNALGVHFNLTVEVQSVFSVQKVVNVILMMVVTGVSLLDPLELTTMKRVKIIQVLTFHVPREHFTTQRK